MTWLITPGQLDARDADANAYMDSVIKKHSTQDTATSSAWRMVP